MIVDSSALIAIVRSEPEEVEFANLIQRATAPAVSAATLFEASIVATSDRHVELDEIMVAGGFTVVAFDSHQARLARDAYVRYGKGSGSPARLNFGDCFSYALAKSTGQPLLFKGDDFTHTDITPAR